MWELLDTSTKIKIIRLLNCSDDTYGAGSTRLFFYKNQ